MKLYYMPFQTLVEASPYESLHAQPVATVLATLCAGETEGAWPDLPPAAGEREAMGGAKGVAAASMSEPMASAAVSMLRSAATCVKGDDAD